jgi:hypothetical protein
MVDRFHVLPVDADSRRPKKLKSLGLGVTADEHFMYRDKRFSVASTCLILSTVGG